MLNETIEGLLGISLEWWEALSLIVVVAIGIIAAVIKKLFQDEILSFINYVRYFKKIVLYKNAEKLQQRDFEICHPRGANKEAYTRKKSDDEIENCLKDSKDLLIIVMPKAGNTRSAYQATKLVLPEFYVIKPPAEKLPDFIFPRFKKNYLLFFDDLNKFTDVNFDFKRFLDKFRSKSNRMIVLSTCRSGDELDTVKSKSMEFFRRFDIVDLNNYTLSEAEGEHLAKDAGVEWKSEQFNGTAGSVILDDEDMKERYKHLDDRQKAILWTCKLLRSANIFTYKKDLIKNVCDHIFETKIRENIWIGSIAKLESSSLITEQGKSINNVNVYDSTLDSVVDDYSPDGHLPPLMELLIGLKDAENLFYLGNAFYERKDYKNAEKCYRKYSEFNLDNAAAHSNLGILLNNQGRYDEAEKEFRDAIRADLDYAAAHYNLGFLLDDQERYDEAEKEYRDAIRADPDHASAHSNLGSLLHNLKRYDEAEEEYREAIRADPDDAAAHSNLGLLLNDQGRYDEAEKEYRGAIRADPDHASAHSNLGSLLQNLKRYDEAEEEYREAIRADPDDAEAHANLGILFLETKRLEEAKKEFEIAKELFKNQGRDEDVKKVEELRLFNILW
jgi:tetratricopeptide (TPR) repeat protein